MREERQAVHTERHRRHATTAHHTRPDEPPQHSLQGHTGGGVLSNLDGEDVKFLNDQFGKVYDKLDHQGEILDKDLKEVRSDISTNTSNIKKLDERTKWHTWAIRILVLIAIGGGTAGGYIAIT